MMINNAQELLAYPTSYRENGGWCLQALVGLIDKEKSGLAATAELSRRDAEVKAKEESDLVQACQVKSAR